MKQLLLVGPHPKAGDGIAKYEHDFIEAYRKYYHVMHLHEHFIRHKNPFSILRTVKVAQRYQPVAVHFQFTPTICGPLFPVALRRLRQAGITTIVTMHERIDVYHHYLGPLKTLGNLYEQRIIREATHVTVHNEGHRRYLIRQGGDPKKIHVIPHPITERKTTRKRKNKNKKTIIGYFGQIRPKKGVDLLLEAYQGLPLRMRERTELRILGGATDEHREYLDIIKKRARGQKDIIFYGYLDEESITIEVPQLDLLVLPYRNCTESGILYREAIPFGIPVLASRKGGLVNVELLGIGKNFSTTEELRRYLQDFIEHGWGLGKHAHLRKKLRITKLINDYRRLIEP